MLRQASLLVGVFVIDILLLRFEPWGGFPVVYSMPLPVDYQGEITVDPTLPNLSNLKQKEKCLITESSGGYANQYFPLHDLKEHPMYNLCMALTYGQVLEDNGIVTFSPLCSQSTVSF